MSFQGNDKFSRPDNIFIALLTIQIIPAVIILYLVRTGFAAAPVVDAAQVKSFTLILNIVLIVTGILVYRFSAIKGKKEPEEKKFTLFRAGSITRLFLIAAAGLVNQAAFLFTGDYVYIIVSGIIIILFLIYRPTEKSYKRDYY